MAIGFRPIVTSSSDTWPRPTKESLYEYAGAAGQARDDVVFDTEGGHIAAVDDVRGLHGEAHRPAHRNVQRIDLALSSGVFGLPHPLFAKNVHVDWHVG